MMNYPEAVYMVKAIVRKRKFLGIGDDKVARDIENRESFFGKFDGVRRQVKASIDGAGFGKFQAVRRNTTANFQHFFAFIGGKVGDDRYVPLTAIKSVVRYFLEISTAFCRV